MSLTKTESLAGLLPGILEGWSTSGSVTAISNTLSFNGKGRAEGNITVNEKTWADNSTSLSIYCQFTGIVGTVRVTVKYNNKKYFFFCSGGTRLDFYDASIEGDGKSTPSIEAEAFSTTTTTTGTVYLELAFRSVSATIGVATHTETGITKYPDSSNIDVNTEGDVDLKDDISLMEPIPGTPARGTWRQYPAPDGDGYILQYYHKNNDYYSALWFCEAGVKQYQWTTNSWTLLGGSTTVTGYGNVILHQADAWDNSMAVGSTALHVGISSSGTDTGKGTMAVPVLGWMMGEIVSQDAPVTPISPYILLGSNLCEAITGGYIACNFSDHVSIGYSVSSAGITCAVSHTYNSICSGAMTVNKIDVTNYTKAIINFTVNAKPDSKYYSRFFSSLYFALDIRNPLVPYKFKDADIGTHTAEVNISSLTGSVYVYLFSTMTGGESLPGTMSVTVHSIQLINPNASTTVTGGGTSTPTNTQYTQSNTAKSVAGGNWVTLTSVSGAGTATITDFDCVCSECGEPNFDASTVFHIVVDGTESELVNSGNFSFTSSFAIKAQCTESTCQEDGSDLIAYWEGVISTS